MKYPALALFVVSFAVMGCTGPGQPGPGVEVPTPQSISSFQALYGQNCAACHGEQGHSGPAFDLANPAYQAWVSDATLTQIVANGESGAQMPAFAKSAGGFLTDQQVADIIHGMRSNWQKSGALNGQTPPPYQSTLKGDAAHGQQVYQTACARCHQKASQSITGATFLALMNDQTLRSVIIAGRPDIGQPDWRGDVPGHPLTDQEITDVVAWLASQRSQTPGQPYKYPQ